jgi:hypothetical protein
LHTSHNILNADDMLAYTQLGDIPSDSQKVGLEPIHDSTTVAWRLWLGHVVSDSVLTRLPSDMFIDHQLAKYILIC